MRVSITKLSISLMATILTGCGSGAHKMDLTSYAPVIDVYQYDSTQYQTDLNQCRELAVRAQAKYEEQQKKEKADMLTSAIVGAVIGAAIGNALDDNNDSATTIGAVYGAGIGASQAADANDYNRLITKFGPSAVVDNCMTGRGYQILSEQGYGGG